MISETWQRRARRTFIASAVWFCALSCFRPVVGAEPAEDEVYKQTIEQALGEFKRQNWPEARVMFLRAHELNPSARTLRGLGVVSFEMRDYVNAVLYLSAAASDPRQRLSESQRKETVALLERARTYVGVFEVTVQPADANLTLNDEPPPRDEQGNLLLSFGEHTITASAPGFEPQSETLNVKGGERGELTLTLAPEGSGAAQLSPSDPSAASDSGQAAFSPRASVERPVSVAPVQPSDRLIGGGLKYTWVTLSTSAVFGGAAGLFWMLGQNELDSLDKACQARAEDGDPCEPSNTDVASVERYQRLTNASLGVSAAALGVTVLFMSLEWPRERAVSVQAGLNGFSIRGEF